MNKYDFIQFGLVRRNVVHGKTELQDFADPPIEVKSISPPLEPALNGMCWKRCCASSRANDSRGLEASAFILLGCPLRQIRRAGLGKWMKQAHVGRAAQQTSSTKAATREWGILDPVSQRSCRLPKATWTSQGRTSRKTTQATKLWSWDVIM